MTAAGAGSAVHVGVDRPDPAHYGDALPPLCSAEHDARAMAQLTAAQRFDPSTVVVGTAATVTRIRDEIANAASVLNTGDSFILTFAGYGGLVPGIDRSLCAYDEQLLISVLLADLARFQPGVRVVIIEDASPRALTAADGVRALPAGVAELTYDAHRAVYDTWGERARAGKRSFMVPVLTLHACGVKQEAREGNLHGLFTGALLAAWSGGEYLHSPAPSYRDLIEKTGILMSGSQQTPELSTLTTNDQRIAYRPPFVLGI